MYPTIVDFGFVGIHSFGLMLFTAFITSGIVIQSELKRRGFAPELASAIVMAAAIGGIVGAKLYSALLDGQITFQELFSTSGIVWYGGFIGGCLAVIIVIVRSSNPFLPTIDIVGPTVILGYGIGRIGCLLAGDGDYGPPSDLPWALAFPNGTVPTDVPVHPTPIYETLLSWAFFGILWSQRRKFEGTPGVVFGASLVLLGVERFIAEFWRITPRVLGWMSAAQLFSIGAFIFGIVLILWMFTHPRSVEGEVREPRQRDSRT
ncbi:prolipoprotein diacylglyceryl transferase [Candidatus Poribacteria bacterium]|nr:prolipoprotein diacylglyceryl transferase [Candidatus Poribacteria bacterium]